MINYDDLWEKIKRNDCPKVIKKYPNGAEIIKSFNGKQIVIKCKVKDLHDNIR